MHLHGEGTGGTALWCECEAGEEEKRQAAPGRLGRRRRTCPGCKKLFEPDGKTQVFCGDACMEELVRRHPEKAEAFERYRRA